MRQAAAARSLPMLAVLFLLWSAAAPLGQSRGVPAPASVFGFEPGADYKLASYDQAIAYFRALAATSKYVRLVEAGRTTQGRPIVFALISTPDNLDRIDRYREIAQRLAHPGALGL